MKITITSANVITEIEPGQRARVWEGVTEAGVKCKVFVARLAVHEDQDASQFERELKETAPPGGSETLVLPLRMVL